MLLALCVAGHALASTVWAQHLGFGPSPVAGIAGTTLLVALTASLLAIAGRIERIVQTVSAIVGADLLLSAAAVLLVSVAGIEPEAAAQAPAPLLAQALFLGLLVWHVAVYGHVLRQALSVSPMIGVLIAIVFFATFTVVFDGLFPLER